MWKEIRNLLGPEEDGRERLVTTDFERAAINAFLDTYPQSEVAGRFFHLGQSVYRKVKELGLSGKYLADEGCRLRAKTLAALAFLPIEEVTEGYELIEGGFADEEQEFLAYFAATYIGRRLPAGRRRPLFEHQWWGVDDRMTTGALRTNNAIESFRIAFSRGIAQAGHPTVYRFLEALHLHQNITCGAIDISPHNPNRSRNRRT